MFAGGQRSCRSCRSIAIAVNGSLHTRLNSIMAQYAPHTVMLAPSERGSNIFSSISMFSSGIAKSWSRSELSQADSESESSL